MHAVLAFEALLDDVHVQQPEETASESEAQRLRDFRFVVKRGVVEVQLLERVAQGFVLVRLDRIQAGEHLRLDFFETRQGLAGRLIGVRERVAHLRRAQFLDAGDDESNFAGRQFVPDLSLRREDSDLLAQMRIAGAHQSDFLFRPQASIDNPHQHDDAHVVVEP